MRGTLTSIVFDRYLIFSRVQDVKPKILIYHLFITVQVGWLVGQTGEIGLNANKLEFVARALSSGIATATLQHLRLVKAIQSRRPTVHPWCLVIQIAKMKEIKVFFFIIGTYSV